MPDSNRALIVFAKIPQPNKVKTRLTTVLSPEEAAELYDAFLKDALDVYLSMALDVRLYFSPSDLEVPAELQPDGVTIYWQKGEDLGARMATAFAETFIEGYQEAVIIGTDHPTLPPAFLEQAYQVMAAPKAISIGPSEDGGYYLLGMNAFYSEVFQHMTYSHDQVFADTLERIRNTDATLHVLPEWYDVDEPETLHRLIKDVLHSDLALPRTRKTLSKLTEGHPELN